jgi:integrase
MRRRVGLHLNPRLLAKQIAQELSRGEDGPPSPTLEDFFPRFLKEHAVANRHKPRGVEAKESIFRVHLKERLGSKRLDEITSEDVQALKLSLSERDPKTVNNILATLNKTLKTAVKWGVLSEMPCAVEFVRTELAEVAFYDFAQYARLVKEAALLGLQVLVMVLLGGDAGLRRNEMIALMAMDVNLKLRLLTVRHQDLHGRLVSTKGNRPRVIPLTDALHAALFELLKTRDERVLLNDDNRPLSIQTIRTWMGWAQKAAGLPHLGALHVLRHTFCSHLAMRGAPVMTIKDLAGHKSLRTTMRYMHLAHGERDRAIALLNKRDGGRTRPNTQGGH